MIEKQNKLKKRLTTLGTILESINARQGHDLVCFNVNKDTSTQTINA